MSSHAFPGDRWGVACYLLFRRPYQYCHERPTSLTFDKLFFVGIPPRHRPDNGANGARSLIAIVLIAFWPSSDRPARDQLHRRRHRNRWCARRAEPTRQARLRRVADFTGYTGLAGRGLRRGAGSAPPARRTPLPCIADFSGHAHRGLDQASTRLLSVRRSLRTRWNGTRPR